MKTCSNNSETGRFEPKHGQFGTPEYNAWRSMLKRCYSQSSASYARYGGRGIAVCQAWRMSFATFLQDVGKRPTPRHSLGRIDNDGHYEASNVRWETAKQQQANRRSVRILELRGERLCLADWSARLSIPRSTLLARLKRGWSHDAALTTPIDLRKGIHAKP